jgi:GDP-4-dehydro-6-deoxy-D-mannose reductase
VRALVTGASGFVGQWLIRALLRDGWHVTGATLDERPETPLLERQARDAVRWVATDVRSLEAIRQAIDVAQPDAIFHLAGVTFVPSAAADPGLTTEVNVVAAARLIAEVRTRRRAGVLDPVVLVIGSGEEYGRHDEAELPLTERAELRPHGVYAATKVAQEVMALEAHRTEGVRVIATRSFNHSGPGQAERMLLPALVTRALALRGATGGRLSIGNTTTTRDFSHVRDVVEAYLLLVRQGTPGEVYNVCSGRGVRVDEMASYVLARTGVDATPYEDPALVRRVEVPALVGSPAKLAALGWRATATAEDIVDELIDAATR